MVFHVAYIRFLLDTTVLEFLKGIHAPNPNYRPQQLGYKTVPTVPKWFYVVQDIPH